MVLTKANNDKACLRRREKERERERKRENNNKKTTEGTVIGKKHERIAGRTDRASGSEPP